MAIFGLDPWAARLVGAAIVVAVAILALTLLSWLVPRLLARANRSGTPERARQRRTAASVLASSLRYVIAIAALIAVFVLLAGGGPLGAVGSAALVIAITGFAAQRLLTDVIAGFFVLLEGQYQVGDLVRLEPTGITGIVEEVGIRTTIVRERNGDLCHVPNGQVTGVRRAPPAGRTLRLWLVTRDPEAVEAALPDVARSISGAVDMEGRSHIGDDLWAVMLEADAAPGDDQDAGDRLAAALRARLASVLVGDPQVVGAPPRSAGGGPES